MVGGGEWMWMWMWRCCDFFFLFLLVVVVVWVVGFWWVVGSVVPTMLGERERQREEK